MKNLLFKKNSNTKNLLEQVLLKMQQICYSITKQILCDVSEVFEMVPISF